MWVNCYLNQHIDDICKELAKENRQEWQECLIKLSETGTCPFLKVISCVLQNITWIICHIVAALYRETLFSTTLKWIFPSQIPRLCRVRCLENFVLRYVFKTLSTTLPLILDVASYRLNYNLCKTIYWVK